MNLIYILQILITHQLYEVKGQGQRSHIMKNGGGGEFVCVCEINEIQGGITD